MGSLEVRLQNRLGDFRLDVDFAIPGTGVTALFGRSGSEKTSVLRAIARLGLPSLYVSHDPKEPARLADQMVLLDLGSVVAQGTAADLMTRLALKAHSDTSIVKILPATVIDTREINPSHLLVCLQLADGQHLLSRITRWAGMAIGLHEGMQLYAQVKSVALIT